MKRVLALAFFLPQISHAFIGPIYADIEGLTGFSQPTVVESAAEPTLLGPGLAASLGYKIADGLAIGGSVAWRALFEVGTIDPKVGNFSGHRLSPFAPMLAFSALGGVLLKGDLEILGNYVLDHGVGTGAASYGSPLGARVSLLLPVLGPIPLKLGAGAEYVQLSRINTTNGGSQSLTTSLKLWQLGLEAALVL